MFQKTLLPTPRGRLVRARLRVIPERNNYIIPKEESSWNRIKHFGKDGARVKTLTSALTEAV